MSDVNPQIATNAANPYMHQLVAIVTAGDGILPSECGPIATTARESATTRVSEITRGSENARENETARESESARECVDEQKQDEDQADSLGAAPDIPPSSSGFGDFASIAQAEAIM